jgi:hypothetical protein
MKKAHKSIFRLIAKALGEKTGKNDREADKIAFIRFLITAQILITNFFIIANAIRHWNDIEYTINNSNPHQIK